LLAVAQTALHFYHHRAEDTGLGAAEKAMALDPTLAEPHAVKGRHLWQHGKKDEAEAEVGTALRLGPESWEANHEAARLSYLLNRIPEATRYFEKAAALSENGTHAWFMLISCYSALGDEEGMRRAARMTLDNAEQAIAQDPGNGNALAHGVSALAALGERERAKEWIYRALLIETDNTNMRYNFACVACFLLKDVELALELLQGVLATSTISYVRYAEKDPDLETIRKDPRFVKLLADAEARLGGRQDLPT
jgi:adenylate cyclase